MMVRERETEKRQRGGRRSRGKKCKAREMVKTLLSWIAFIILTESAFADTSPDDGGDVICCMVIFHFSS